MRELFVICYDYGMEQSAGFEALSAEELYRDGDESEAVGVGVQILPCSGDEDCYAPGGCSVMIALEDMPEGVSVNDVVSHPKDYEVVVIQSCLCMKYALQRKK